MNLLAVVLHVNRSSGVVGETDALFYFKVSCQRILFEYASEIIRMKLKIGRRNIDFHSLTFSQYNFTSV